MGLRQEEHAAELLGDVRAAHEAVHEAVSNAVTRERTRIRAAASTRKSARTRKRIMEAASNLMTERGTTDFQMSEVAERCGVSKGALYYYFADREELAEAVFDQVLEDTMTAIEHIANEAPTAREAIDGLCAEMTRRFEAGSPLALAATNELAHSHGDILTTATERLSRIVRVVAAQIERAKDEGIVRDDVDAALVATFVVGGFLMTSLASASG
ncbi:MAG: TetR/AcrR family transcriptional regulator [Atopobiaceae bacterium]|nr:TetR/AcrR family transcriptional regulator [Atopobiaceae bacterium]